MVNLTVSPTLITVTDSTENTVMVNFTCDKTLTDVKLSMDGGITYKNKTSMTQTSAIFDITGMSNNNYNCKLKGYYENSVHPEDGNSIITKDGYELITRDSFVILFK